jgi:hypothetical protein
MFTRRGQSKKLSYSSFMRERLDDRKLRVDNHDAQSQWNYLVIPITPSTHFANTDLPKITANLSYEPVHLAPPAEVSETKKFFVLPPLHRQDLA